MFAGIIEAQSRVLKFTVTGNGEDRSAELEPSLAQIVLEKPIDFTDIVLGDSIAVNGVCLTVEAFDDRTITFSLGRETLAITGWSAQTLQNKSVNLERSLKFGDRVHGHFVSGHVDALGTVTAITGEGSVNVDVQIPPSLKALVYKKGSIAINGVSLTVNAISADNIVSVCLIPETLKRTNLSALQVGGQTNIEVDQFARAIQQALTQQKQSEAQL